MKNVTKTFFATKESFYVALKRITPTKGVQIEDVYAIMESIKIRIPELELFAIVNDYKMVIIENEATNKATLIATVSDDEEIKTFLSNEDVKRMTIK